MQFQSAVELANSTPVSVLCEAWGESVDYVVSRQSGEHPMSLREAGDLADVYHLKLLDVLAV
jgi:hypothetical protein